MTKHFISSGLTIVVTKLGAFKWLVTTVHTAGHSFAAMTSVQLEVDLQMKHEDFRPDGWQEA